MHCENVVRLCSLLVFDTGVRHALPPKVLFRFNRTNLCRKVIPVPFEILYIPCNVKG